jgi:hypothetical protein
MRVATHAGRLLASTRALTLDRGRRGERPGHRRGRTRRSAGRARQVSSVDSDLGPSPDTLLNCVCFGHRRTGMLRHGCLQRRNSAAGPK